MRKRALAAVLWFVAGTYTAAMVAWFLGWPGIVAPLAGLASAAVVAGDPFRLIWTPRAQQTAETELEPAADPV